MNWVEYWSQSGYDDQFWRRSIEWYCANLVKYFDLNPKMSVLDFGSGPGFTGIFLSPSIANLLLVEKSNVLINSSIKTNENYNNVKHFHLKDLSQIQAHFRNNKYDLVLINSVIQYLHPYELKELLNILQEGLKKDSRIIISDIIRHDPLFITDIISVYKYYSDWFGFLKFLKHLLSEMRQWKNRAKLNLFKYTPHSFEEIIPPTFSIRWTKNPTICNNRLCAILTIS